MASELLVQVLAEIGAASIEERYISDRSKAALRFMRGFAQGTTIVVNPAHDIVDTLIHEVLHRLRPDWPEATVRLWTTRLRKELSEEEVRAIWAEYRKRAKRVKTPLVLT